MNNKLGMRKKSLLLFALLMVLMAQAQETKNKFSLKEAVAYALQHNRNATNAQLNIDAAKRQKWETTATGLPQINAKIEYQNFLKQPVSLIPAAAFDPNDTSGDYLTVTFGTKQNMNVGATLSQLLFDGSYIVALQSAKVFLDITQNAKEKTDNEIKTAVIASYNNALLVNESIAIMKKNMATLQKSLTETTKIYENGMTEEENVEQLQLTLNNLENNLRNLTQLKSVSNDYLKLMLGISDASEIELTDSLDAIIALQLADDLKTNSFSIFNNVDIKIAENDTKAKGLLYKLEQSRSLPTLSAFLNTGYAGYSNSFTFLNSDQSWYGSALVGVNLSVPIFTSFQGKARRDRAKINWEISENNLKETKDKIKLETKKVKSEYTLSIDTYMNKQKSLALAERIEAKNSIKFKEGLAGSFDLREAQMQLYSAQQEYLQSMINVINKKAELENILNVK
jgi:outer membrane protein TolC